eukprot:gene1321-32674_t
MSHEPPHMSMNDQPRYPGSIVGQVLKEVVTTKWKGYIRDRGGDSKPPTTNCVASHVIAFARRHEGGLLAGFFFVWLAHSAASICLEERFSESVRKVHMVEHYEQRVGQATEKLQQIQASHQVYMSALVMANERVEERQLRMQVLDLKMQLTRLRCQDVFGSCGEAVKAARSYPHQALSIVATGASRDPVTATASTPADESSTSDPVIATASTPGLTADESSTSNPVTATASTPGLTADGSGTSDQVTASVKISGLAADMCTTSDQGTGRDSTSGLAADGSGTSDQVTASVKIPGLAADMCTTPDQGTASAKIPGLAAGMCTTSDQGTGRDSTSGLAGDEGGTSDQVTAATSISGLTADEGGTSDQVTATTSISGRVTDGNSTPDQGKYGSNISGRETDGNSISGRAADGANSSRRSHASQTAWNMLYFVPRILHNLWTYPKRRHEASCHAEVDHLEELKSSCSQSVEEWLRIQEVAAAKDEEQPTSPRQISVDMSWDNSGLGERGESVSSESSTSGARGDQASVRPGHVTEIPTGERLEAHAGRSATFVKVMLRVWRTQWLAYVDD